MPVLKGDPIVFVDARATKKNKQTNKQTNKQKLPFVCWFNGFPACCNERKQEKSWINAGSKRSSASESQRPAKRGFNGCGVCVGGISKNKFSHDYRSKQSLFDLSPFLCNTHGSAHPAFFYRSAVFQAVS